MGGAGRGRPEPQKSKGGGGGVGSPEAPEDLNSPEGVMLRRLMAPRGSPGKGEAFREL